MLRCLSGVKIQMAFKILTIDSEASPSLHDALVMVLSIFPWDWVGCG